MSADILWGLPAALGSPHFRARVEVRIICCPTHFGTLGLPVQTLAGQFSAAPPGGPGRPAPPSDSLAGHPVAHVGGGGQQRRGRSNPARRCQASSTLGSDHPNARAPLWGSERLGCSRAASFRRPAPPSLGRPACLITSSGLL